MTCGECGNVTAPGAGFQNHVYCKRFLLHMKKREDASRCRDFIPKPKTNGDNFRAMTDEELAEWLACNCDCASTCMAMKPCCAKSEKDCVQAWKEWLKQECAE